MLSEVVTCSSRCNTTTNRSRPKCCATVPAGKTDPMGARVMYPVKATASHHSHHSMCNKPPRQLQAQRQQPATSAAAMKLHPPMQLPPAGPTRHSRCNQPAPPSRPHPASAAATSHHSHHSMCKKRPRQLQPQRQQPHFSSCDIATSIHTLVFLKQQHMGPVAAVCMHLPPYVVESTRLDLPNCSPHKSSLL